MSVNFENIDDPSAIYAVVRYGEDDLKVRIGTGRRGVLKALMSALIDNHLSGYYYFVGPKDLLRPDERLEASLAQSRQELDRAESALEEMLGDAEGSEAATQELEREISELKRHVHAIARNTPQIQEGLEKIVQQIAEASLDVDDVIHPDLQEAASAVIPEGVQFTYGNFAWWWLELRTGQIGYEHEDVDVVLAEQFS